MMARIATTTHLIFVTAATVKNFTHSFVANLRISVKKREARYGTTRLHITVANQTLQAVCKQLGTRVSLSLSHVTFTNAMI